MDFHPYGDFLSSGSHDTNLKLWDIRRKGCIFTYKGHRQKVNSVKFSPDGQWIASAGEEGAVKVRVKTGRKRDKANASLNLQRVMESSQPPLCPQISACFVLAPPLVMSLCDPWACLFRRK